VTRMPETEKKLTDSWRAHEEFLRAIQRYLAEISTRDGDVWIGEVCFGAPNQPWVRAPLRKDSAALVEISVRRAEEVAADVTRTLARALQVTGDTVKQLQAQGVVDAAGLARVIERNQALEGLLEKLTQAATLGPLACHPGRASRWFEILEQGFVPGNPAVEVRVVTTYVL